MVGDRLGQMLLDIARHLTQHLRFNRYPEDIKEDLVSDAVLKMINNLKNIKEEKKGGCFSYFTACAWCSFIDTLAKHYKEYNKRRQLLINALEDLQLTSPYPRQHTMQLVNELKKQLSYLQVETQPTTRRTTSDPGGRGHRGFKA